MTRPQWWSQRFAAEGSAAAEGISKQLGRPALDPLTILVREAAQNSWDARLPGSMVDFRISVQTLDEARADTWRRRLLPGPHGEAGQAVVDALSAQQHLLVISDRGTRGLGGPLRADEKAPEGVVPNFVQFLRNVGEPSDHEYGGGTYGFGKGILYGVSGAGAIIVDTYCHDGCGADRRLMGAALSSSFYDGETRYTGRHWWGDCSGEIPDPVLGAEADRLAGDLGLPGFGDGWTGSDIVIVGADLGVVFEGTDDERRRTPMEAGSFLASSMLWNMWPKWGSTKRARAMNFSVEVDGEQVDIPSPTTVPELMAFAQALDDIHTGDCRRYERRDAPRHGGDISLRPCPADPSHGRGAGSIIDLAAPITAPYRHVARMRTAELVVDYFEGVEHPDPLLGYAGVFMSSRDSDPDFAVSEPPTHDDWVERGLSGRQRSVVRGSRQFIRNSIARHLPQTDNMGTTLAGLGQFAARLAGLAAMGRPTDGDSSQPGAALNVADPRARDATPDSGLNGSGSAGSGGPSHRRVVNPSIVKSPAVMLNDGVPMVVAHVAVPPATHGRRITVTPQVVLNGGGRESDPPSGAVALEVLGWWPLGQSEWCSREASLSVAPADSDQVFGVAVRYDPDVTMRFALASENV